MPNDEEKMLQKLREKLGAPKKVDERAELERLFGKKAEAPEDKLRKSLQVKGPQVGEQHLMTIKRLAFNGMGIGQVEHLDVFVDGPVPGDTVKVEITDVADDRLTVRVLETVAPSSNRVKPRCPYFGSCGGCHIQCLAYPAQLQVKHQMVKDAVSRGEERDIVQVRNPIPSPEPYGYAIHCRMLVSLAEGKLKIGYRSRTGDAVLGIDACPLVTPNLNRAIACLQEAITKKDAGGITGITLLTTGTESNAPLLAHFDCSRSGLAPDRMMAALEKQQLPIKGVAATGPEGTSFAGEFPLPLGVSGVTVPLGSTKAFPANLLMLKTYREQAIQLASPTPRDAILEINGGIGIMSRAMAKFGDRVTLIDDDPVVRQLIETRGAADSKVAFVPSSLQEALRTKLIQKGAFDLVMLHGRETSDSALMAQLAELEIPKVLYLNQTLGVLARDLALFAAAGYRLRVIQPLDLLPHSRYVMVMAFLTHKYAGASALLTKFSDL